MPGCHRGPGGLRAGLSCDHALGPDPALERHCVPTRSQRARSVLTSFTLDSDTHNLVYANADLSKVTQAREAIMFCDHWHGVTGHDPRTAARPLRVPPGHEGRVAGARRRPHLQATLVGRTAPWALHGRQFAGLISTTPSYAGRRTSRSEEGSAMPTPSPPGLRPSSTVRSSPATRSFGWPRSSM